MRGRLCIVTLLVGCYHPTIATEVPCSVSGECPTGQHCDPNRNVCTTEASSPDAMVSADAQSIDAPPAATPPQFRAHSFVDGDTTTTTVAVPMGTVAGDLLLAHVSCDLTTAADIVVPAGWTRIIERDGVQDPHYAGAFYRRAIASETSYVWTFPSIYNSIALTAFSGVAAMPVDIADAQVSNDMVPPTAPSITTTRPNTLLVVMLTQDLGNGPFADIANMTEIYSIFTGNLYVHGAYEPIVMAGATGPRSTTTPDMGPTIGISIALSPGP